MIRPRKKSHFTIPPPGEGEWAFGTFTHDFTLYDGQLISGTGGLVLNATGTVMYIATTSHFDDSNSAVEFTGFTNSIRAFTLSTAYDVTTASFTSDLQIPDAGSGSIKGLVWGNSGNKLYVLKDATGNEKIYQYSCSTAYNAMTATYDSKSFDVASFGDLQKASLAFKTDGTKMYMGTHGGGGSEYIVEFDLSTAWDVTTATTASSDLAISEKVSGLYFKSDGLEMYIVNADDDFEQWTLSTAWDVSTATFTSRIDLAASSTNVWGVYFKSDGTKAYTIDVTGQSIIEIDLSTAWTVSTASINDESVSFKVDTSVLKSTRDATFGNSGVYFISITSNQIRKYTLSVPYDIGSITATQVSATITEDGNVSGVHFSTSGDKMFLTGWQNDNVYEYTLSTAWDLSTLSYVGSFSVATQNTFPVGLNFNEAGTKFVTAHLTTGDLFQYSLSTPWTISTASYDSVSFASGSRAEGYSFSNDGLYAMHFYYATPWTITLYELSTAWDISTMTSINTLTPTDAGVPIDWAFIDPTNSFFQLVYQNYAVNQYTIS